LSSSEDNMVLDPPNIPKEIETQYVYLKEMCVDLQIPFDGHAAVDTLLAVKSKVLELLKTLPPDYIKDPLFSKQNFSPQQMKDIEDMNEALREEYTYRFTVLKKRLDVTLQGFLWCDEGKKHEAEIKEIVSKKIVEIPSEPDITLHDLFCAHTDLGVISKTSSLSTQSPSVVKSVVVGEVPDRGGRPGEGRQGSMPSFKARGATGDNPPPKRGRGGRIQGGGWQGRGGGGGGKGGRGDSINDDNDNNNNNNNNNDTKENQGGKKWGGKKGKKRW